MMDGERGTWSYKDKETLKLLQSFVERLKA
jgi:hypothetical protein